ncbi:unnamed protein product [Pleuronectes platessa]|uniref:Secreted protein n=1 Tax=Pleuronectes platessa TaxID=8262 RepID=A0A9N7UUH9_PLEPL|nr:unnamed protein product [Pleuronectes platessa]
MNPSLHRPGQSQVWGCRHHLWVLCCVWQGAWLAPAAADETHLRPISSHHPLHKGLVVFPLHCQIIPSMMNLCVSLRSASRPGSPSQPAPCRSCLHLPYLQ